MTKIVYPSEGVKNIIKSNIESTSNSLSSAINNTYYNVPSDFGYYNYLKDLNSTLTNYKKEAQKIMDIAASIDTKYNDLDTDLKSDSQKLPTSKMSQRDRMIVQ